MTGRSARHSGHSGHSSYQVFDFARIGANGTQRTQRAKESSQPLEMLEITETGQSRTQWTEYREPLDFIRTQLGRRVPPYPLRAGEGRSRRSRLCSTALFSGEKYARKVPAADNLSASHSKKSYSRTSYKDMSRLCCRRHLRATI
jgi:hypothetical protein